MVSGGDEGGGVGGWDDLIRGIEEVGGVREELDNEVGDEQEEKKYEDDDDVDGG